MIKQPNIETFEFTANEKKFSLILIVVGLICTAIGLFTNLDVAPRLWTGLMYNNFFFLFLALTACFFVTSQSLGYNGWYILVKRVPEAMMTFVPIGAILMAIILFFGLHDIYHWSHTDTGLYDPDSANYDELLASKQPFLNASAFYIRMAVYLVLWSGLTLMVRKNSVASDLNPDKKLYNSGLKYSALFLVVFGVTSSTSTWDYLMSIQPHWYSTLFGWYCFISMFVTTIAFTIIIVKYLKSKGYMQAVNQEHMHDLGKLMFAFSVAWTYLFFSQFMLIWYANIPEETMYYMRRLDSHPFLMWFLLVVNFVLPFFVLITAGNKRRGNALVVIACFIIFGHWLDFYQMSVPAAMTEMHLEPTGLGFYEIGLGLTYLGFFTFVMFNSLAKASLVPINHPFVKESVIHHT